MIISIQEKSKDSRFPMNGKLTNIGNLYSIAFNDGILFITYIDNDEKIEIQFRLDNISYFFLN